MNRRWLAIVLALAACAGDDREQVVAEQGAPRPPGGPTTIPVVKPEATVHVTLLSAGAEPRQTLRYRPAVGTEQSLLLDSKIDVAMTMGEHPMFAQHVATKSRVVLRVAEVTGDRLAFELTVVDMEMPSYDPTNFAPAPRLAGAKGRFTITDRGVLVDQHLPFLESVEARDALHLPDYMYVLPGEPVGVGAKWEVRSVVLRNGIGVQSIETHELMALDGATGRTTSRVTLDSWPQIVPTIAQDPLTVFEVQTFRSSGSGEARFDLARALPVVANTAFEFTADMRIRRMEGQQKIDMTMKAQLASTDEGHGRRPR